MMKGAGGGRRGSGGFTLLELLLALSIMTALIVLIFSAFQVGGRAWEKGERLIGKQQLLRVVPELIKRQVASFAVPGVTQSEEGGGFFQGARESVVFFSRASLYPGGQAGLVFVHYLVRGEDGEKILSLYEQNINLLTTTDVADIDTEAYHDLLTGYTTIEFSFLRSAEEGGGPSEWLPDWSVVDSNELPAAIRFVLKKDVSDSLLTIIIPLAVTS